MIDRPVAAGAAVRTRCRLLGGSRQGHYRYRNYPTSGAELRRRWLESLTRNSYRGAEGGADQPGARGAALERSLKRVQNVLRYGYGPGHGDF